MKDLLISIIVAIAVIAMGIGFFESIGYAGEVLRLTPSEQTVFAQLMFYLLLFVGKCILDRL